MGRHRVSRVDTRQSLDQPGDGQQALPAIHQRRAHLLLRLLSLATVAMLVMVVSGSSLAAGQDQAEEPADDEPAEPAEPVAPPVGSLTLLEQSYFTAADGNFSVRLGWSGPITPDLTVSTIIRGKVSRESQLGADTAVLNRLEPIPLITLRQPDGSLKVEFSIRSFQQSGAEANGRILIPDPGVYPVVIEIRDPVGSIASIETYLVRLGTETAEIDLLSVSVILPVSSADGLGLDDVIGILERHPAFPLTVLLETGVVSELLDDPTSAERLHTALGDRTLIVGSGLDLDPSALAEVDQGVLYSRALRASRTALDEIGLRASDTTLPVDPVLTIEGAELLRSLGVTTVFNADSGSSGVIATSSGNLRIARIDEELTALLTTRTESVAAAHLLIARLALRAETDITPVLIGGTALRQASSEAIEILLQAQEQVGVLEPASLDEFSDLSPPLTIRAVENPAQDLAPVADLIGDTLQLIESYRTFHAAGPNQPRVYETGLYAALGRDRNPDDRLRAIEQVGDQIRESFEVITIRDGQSMTLTARHLTVPLSIENTSFGDRMVQLRFTSDKVEVEEDGQVFVIPPGSTTLDINVEARAIGLSPLDVEAYTPDGAQLLSNTQLQIRSTAIPGLGLLLSGAALAFLVSWWIVSIGRTRALKHADHAAIDDHEDTLGVNVDADNPTRTV